MIFKLFAHKSWEFVTRRNKRLTNLSKGREEFLIKEVRYKKIILGKLTPVTEADFYFKKMTYSQFLEYLQLRADKLALYTDAERLKMELAALRKKRTKNAITPKEEKKPLGEFQQPDYKNPKWHQQGAELTDTEIECLKVRKLTKPEQLEKAKAIKYQMGRVVDGKKMGKKGISKVLTNLLGSGYSASSIWPYMAAINHAKELEHPTPSPTVEMDVQK